MLNTDVQAYLRRINHDVNIQPDKTTLASLHRAHLFTVPFENLDIHLGRKIVCDERRILHKIVQQRRGGFCYELNGAFAALLRALGFQVTLLSARVARPDGSYSPDFDHLALRVDLEEPWLADVGFGEGFLEPLRLDPAIEQRQGDKAYRLISHFNEGDPVFGLEVNAKHGWKREYSFSLRPHELSDFSERCRYHQTSPESHFRQHKICSMATPQGRVTLSEDKLIETIGGSRHETTLAGREEWHAKLQERFGVILPV